MKAARTVGVVFILLASVVSSSAADGPSKALFAYGAINAYMTSTWVAREQGLFRKHSVEVEPVFIIASRAAQSMLAGEVQVGLIGPTHVTNAVAAGGDLVMFTGNQNNVGYIMVTQPSVKRIEELKGKRIAIGASQAGLASLATHAALDHMGLNPRRDKIALLPIGEEPLRLAALQTGNVQATLIAPRTCKHSHKPGIQSPARYGQTQYSISSERHGDHAQASAFGSADARTGRPGHRLCDQFHCRSDKQENGFANYG
jgi:ABC-type nitrate/sulfonate/bicarbonate transport system substrate-binding protein